jgi:1,4-dihydroxy-2-naphthoyl-CoA hydrolase
MPQPEDPSPFDELLGTEWLDYDPDHARVRLAVHDALRQPLGLVHGGVISSLVESICSRATALALWDGKTVVTGQSQSVSFLRPFTEGHINVEAQALHRGRTSWVWEARITDDEGKLCALSQMTVAVRPGR